MNSYVYSILRKLSKSNKWQTIYAQAKEVSGVYVFQNHTDFSYIQIMFLNHLNFYNSLNFDVSLGEVSEVIFKDELYEDAYVYWKQHKNKKEDRRNMTEKKDNRKCELNSSSWVFKKPKKECES